LSALLLWILAAIFLIVLVIAKVNILLSIVLTVVFLYLCVRIREIVFSLYVQKNERCSAILRKLEDVLDEHDKVDFVTLVPQEISVTVGNENFTLDQGEPKPLNLDLLQALSYETVKLLGHDYTIYRKLTQGKSIFKKPKKVIYGFDIFHNEIKRREAEAIRREIYQEVERVRKMGEKKSAFTPADILIPKGCDMEKWSVVACDQYTSEPQYWKECRDFIEDSPSTLDLVLPEYLLKSENWEENIPAIHDNMQKYMERGMFDTYENAFIYIERTLKDGSVRHGLVGKVDLERYDFDPEKNADIRATEGTVLDRIPPRMKVRENAPLELPHVMLLCEDLGGDIFNTARSNLGDVVYDFNLMQNSGHLKGYVVNSSACEEICDVLADRLILVGDGNHSLATARACWFKLRDTLSEEERENHPARYALCELVDLYDEALKFEAIHRVLFDVNVDDLKAKIKALPQSEKSLPVILYHKGVSEEISLPCGPSQLPLDDLQPLLDNYIKEFGGSIDYVHGDDSSKALADADNTLAILLPSMPKESLFDAIIEGGVLPRKTFSMGHAEDKRFYCESRKIIK